MNKKHYLQPKSSAIYLQAKQSLLNYSAQTSNPTIGNDPTGGQGNNGATSPFGAPAAAPNNPFEINH